MRASKIDLTFTVGGAANVAAFTIAAGVTFTDAKVFAYGAKGSLQLFSSGVGAELAIVSQVVTWSPTAAHSKLFKDNSTYSLRLKIGGTWQEVSHGDIDGEGGIFATATNAGAPAGGGGGGGGGGSTPLAYVSGRTYPMPGFSHNANAAIIPGADKVIFTPVVFDQDVSCDRIGFSCGATVSGGKAHLAVYAAAANLWPTGAPVKASEAELTAATSGNNGQALFTAPYAFLKETLYWIGLIGSTSAVGFNVADNKNIQKLGNASFGSMVVAAKVKQAWSIAQTYAATMTWLDRTSGGNGTDLSGSGTAHTDAPLLVFKKA